MRYKAAYRPTEVLDLHNFQFVPLTKEILGTMDRKRYVSPSLEEKMLAGATSEVDEYLDDYVKAQENPSSEEGEALREKRGKAQWVFDAKMPGAMSLDEVEGQSDELGNWPFKLGDRGFYRHRVRLLSYLVPAPETRGWGLGWVGRN